MDRTNLAYLLIMLVLGIGLAIALLSYRYSRYHRSIMRGNRAAKPVWKPFWIP